MVTKLTRQMIEEAVKTYKHKSHAHFELSSDIKPKTLKNVSKHIAKGVNESDIIAVMTFDNIFGKGKEGMALTENRLYFSKNYSDFNKNKLNSVDISDFVNVAKCTSADKKQYFLSIEYENGDELTFYTSIFTGDVLNFFKTLMSLRGDDINENKKAQKTPSAVSESAPPKNDTDTAETAQEIEKRLRAEMEIELKNQREKLEKEYAEKLKSAVAPAAEPKLAPAPIKNSACEKAEPQAQAPSVKPAASQEKNDSVSKVSVMPGDYRNYFTPRKNPKQDYPLLYWPIELANRIYIPNYRWMENENGTPFFIYNLVDILDGSESTLGIIEEEGKLVTSHAIEKKAPGYSLIDPDDKDSLYGIAIIDHKYNCCKTAYTALGIYLKEGKFYDLQTNEIHELVGFERVKNAIKENDFVFACCFGGKHYLVETKKASFAENALYDESKHCWVYKENGSEKTLDFSPIIFKKTTENGKISTKVSLPENGKCYKLYYLADYKNAFTDAPAVYEEIKTEAKKETAPVKPAPVKAPAVNPAPVKAEASKAKKEAPYVLTKYAYQKQEKAAYMVDVPPMWQVFEMLGDYYIVYAITSAYKGRDIEYHLIDLYGRTSTLFVKREKDDVPYRNRHMHHLITSHYKEGYKSSTIGSVTYYTKDGVGFSFRLCGSEHILCYYLGDYKCVDVRTNTRLDFKSTPSISRQLEGAEPNSFVALCKYNGKYHFIMTPPDRTGKYLKLGDINTEKYHTYYQSGSDLIAARPVDNIYYTTYAPNGYGGLPIDNVLVFKDIDCECLYGVIKVVNKGSYSYCRFYDILSKKEYGIYNHIKDEEIATYSNPNYIVRAVNDKSDDINTVRLEKFIKAETLNLNYAYRNGNHGVFMDNDTYESCEIDSKFIPDNVKEGDDLTCRFISGESFKDYVPEGKIYYLKKA